MSQHRANTYSHRLLLLAVGVCFGCVADPILIAPGGQRDSSMPSSRTDSAITPLIDMNVVVDSGSTNDVQLPDVTVENDAVSLDASVRDGGATVDGEVSDTGMDQDVDALVFGPLPDAATMPSDCREPGMTVGSFCTGVVQEEYYCEAFGGPRPDDATMVGSEQPLWHLKDMQPLSCGYEQYYGLESFHGTPTMVVLLWAGCGFCQKQTEKLQQMHYELINEGVTVHFVIVNQSADNPPIEQLTDRCNFPIFQDETAVDAWGLHNGRKDDFYFYDSTGVLKFFLPASGDVVLSSYANPPEEPTSGYLNVKNTVRQLVETDGEPPVVNNMMESSDVP